MKPLCFYVLSSLMMSQLSSIICSPIKFEDNQSVQVEGRSVHNQREESRVFHLHAIKKRKKKKLLHCLLSLQRSNPHGDPRTVFFNYVNLEYNQHAASHGGNEGNGGYSNCLSQFGGGSSGGDDGDNESSGLGGVGEGINNLGSLVGQVGQVPGELIGSVEEGIKPVFENSERYLNRYIIRPLYRSLRPFYRFF